MIGRGAQCQLGVRERHPSLGRVDCDGPSGQLAKRGRIDAVFRSKRCARVLQRLLRPARDDCGHRLDCEGPRRCHDVDVCPGPSLATAKNVTPTTSREVSHSLRSRSGAPTTARLMSLVENA